MIFDRLSLILDKEPHAGSLNMAIDEVLARTAEIPVLRVYRWKEPSVSFGYFGRYAEVRARWPGRVPVRRWTGGGEVPHGEDFTYTITVPAAVAFARGNVRHSYHAIHAALVPHLPGATLAGEDAPDAPACFARPVVADIVTGGTKVAGAAQRRGKFGLLHQGSVQGVAWPENLAQAFAASLGEVVQLAQLRAEILAEASRVEGERYGTQAWLVGR